jgi:hypothetical protein
MGSYVLGGAAHRQPRLCSKSRLISTVGMLRSLLQGSSPKIKYAGEYRRFRVERNAHEPRYEALRTIVRYTARGMYMLTRAHVSSSDRPVGNSASCKF